MIISNTDTKPTKVPTKKELQNLPVNKAKEIKELKEIKALETEDDAPALRPKVLRDLIGQGNIVKQLKLILDSATIRQTMPEHLLFYGQPGLGKTTLASLIANELKANFKVITAPSLQKIGDIVSILVGLEPNTVLFIDEIHRLKAPLEETLYGAMEDGQVDLIMGKGNGIDTLRMDINSFTLVGATTQLGKLSKPLKDRFPTIFQLESYDVGDMFLLVDRSCSILKINIEESAKLLICKRSRGVPRVANNILKRLLDFQVVNNRPLNLSDVEDFFQELGIFDNGLTKADLKYMRALLEGSMGIKTIASVMMEDPETVELVIEPYLLHLGYINKSSEGRSLTNLGKEALLNYKY
jgi:holliday junction DNA helicase RuvB